MPSAVTNTMWRCSALFAASAVMVLVSTLTGCDLFTGAPDERVANVEILRPGDRNVVGASVRFRIAATPRQKDGNYISFVNLTVNGQLAGEAEYIQGTTSPYIVQFDWDSFDVPDSESRIEAIAFDKFQHPYGRSGTQGAMPRSVGEAVLELASSGRIHRERGAAIRPTIRSTAPRILST